jgi:hypothetical protein
MPPKESTLEAQRVRVIARPLAASDTGRRSYWWKAVELQIIVPKSACRGKAADSFGDARRSLVRSLESTTAAQSRFKRIHP